MELYKQCYNCKSRRNVPGNEHIACVNPDPEMTGHQHGIREGWFFYPILFDPIWGTKTCSNYDPIS